MNGPAFGNYDPHGSHCEMTADNANQLIRERLGALSINDLKRRALEAEAELQDLGITFTVYSDKDATDRVLPFDVIPRVLSAEEWRLVESGVCQRVAALNLLLHDLYHGQRILKDGVIPAELVLGNANYRPA